MGISPFSPLLFSPSWPLSPKPRLMPKPPPPTTVDTTAVDTDTVTDTVLDTVDTMVDTTVTPTDTAPTDTDTTSARGLLMLNLKQMLKPESHSTAMLSVILMVSVPMVPTLMLMADTTVTTLLS